MSGRRGGYRSQRRPRVVTTTCATTRDLAEMAFEAECLAVAAAPEPKDCPRCDGAGKGCGACGGLGFVPAAEWAQALQLAFVAACGLVLPCESEPEGGEAA
jgi:hypothetical protein